MSGTNAEMNFNKVSFINPPTIAGSPKMIRTFDCNTESKGNYLYQPYDFVLLSAKFPKETEIVFLDAVAEDLGEKDLLSRISSEVPDVHFVAVGENLFKEDLHFLIELRNKFPETPIIVFGAPFVEGAAQEKVTSIVDGILHNPLDFDLSCITRNLNGLIKGKGFVVNTELFTDPKRKAAQEIKIGIPRHELFISKKYRWPFAENFIYSSVFISWGCPYSCSYCILNSFPNIYRPASEIKEELLEIKRLGIKEIYFADRSFGLPNDVVKDVLKFMINENLKFRWSSYFHPNQYDEELLDLMHRSGCHTIIIGVETSDFKTLKDYGRHQKLDRFNNLLNDCREKNIKVCGDFIIGLPKESQADVLRTIDYSKSIDIDYASFNVAAPLPGSIIKKNAVDNGELKDTVYDSLAKYDAVSNGVLTGSELIKLRNKAVLGFYFRPLYLFKRVFKIRSFQQFVIQFEEMIQIFKKVVF